MPLFFAMLGIVLATVGCQHDDARPAALDAGGGQAGSSVPDARVDTQDAASGTPRDAASADAANAPDASAPTLDAALTSDASIGTHDVCAHAFCEHFDGTMLDAQRWQLSTDNCMGSGQIDIDSTHGYHDSSSLRVQGKAGYCNHVFIEPTSELVPASGPLFVRFYLQLGSAFGDGHVSLLAVHDDVSQKDLRLGGQLGVMIWNRESDDATLPELSPTGKSLSVSPTAQREYCVELMIDPDAGQLSTWLDDAPVAGLQVDSTPTPDIDSQWLRNGAFHPKLSALRIGFESYANDDNTLFIDELAVSGKRIGCLP